MRKVTASGKTVADAVKSALNQLQMPEDQVSIHVIDEGKRGLFGIFGATRAVVQVTALDTAEEDLEQSTKAKEEVRTRADDYVSKEKEAVTHKQKSGDSLDADTTAAIERTKSYILHVAREIGVVELSIEVKVSGRDIYFKLSAPNIAQLIGKRGQTLNALQTLVTVVVNQGKRRFYQVMLDAENYRSKRRETLKQLAKRMADRAIEKNETVELEPMPSFERKIIHKALERRKDIQTDSKGSEPYRFIVIRPDKCKSNLKP